MMISMRLMAGLAVLLGAAAFTANAEDAAKTTSFELAKGKLVLTAPASWKKVEPLTGVVEHEFSAPADAKDGDDTARVTVMGAGGSVEANLDRWYGQFEQPGGGSTKEKAKLEDFEVDGHKVYFVSITGSFKDTMGAGPFSGKPAVLRDGYQMLGAIIVTKNDGQYFVKMTGPAKLLETQVEPFKQMLKDLNKK